MTDAEIAAMILQQGTVAPGGFINKPVNVTAPNTDRVESGLPDATGTVSLEPAPEPAKEFRPIVGGVLSQAWDRGFYRK